MKHNRSKEEEFGSIYGHYSKQAMKLNHSWSSTIQDRVIRETEIETLLTVIKHLTSKVTDNRNLKLLEVGCGNGYVAARILCEFPNLSIEAYDVNADLISTAKSRNLSNCKFEIGDVTSPNFTDTLTDNYDLVFTVRCLINIESHNDRMNAINAIGSMVAETGYLVLLEGFSNGQKKYNEVRKLLSFDEIPPAWHNWYLDLQEIDVVLSKSLNLSRLIDAVEVIGVNSHHLSSHYLATRVIQPLLHQEPNHYMKYRNDYIGQAISLVLPDTIDFSPLQAHIWMRSCQIPSKQNLE